MAKAFHVYGKNVFIDDQLVLEYEANVEELDDKAAEYLVLTEGGNKNNSDKELTNLLLAAIKSEIVVHKEIEEDFRNGTIRTLLEDYDKNKGQKRTGVTPCP